MAKIISILGVMNGKLGNVVMATTGGEVIARAYNPNVANPSTTAQVDQRAKMKLMSQVAAALAPVIVIPKEGLKSSRNLFIKKNFGVATATSGVAQLTYENLQITNGNAGLPAIFIQRSLTSGISVNLDENADGAVSRVVYILYRKTSEATLQFVQSIIVEAAGSLGLFPGSFPYLEGDIVVFAYGMKDLSAKATTKYNDYSVQNGEDIAKLALTRRISSTDFQFTKTRGTTLFAGETESITIGDNEARVYVTAAGPGTVAGAGVFELGSQVTVSATPSADAAFVGWRVNGSDTIISRSPSYTFELQGLTDLVAVFRSTAAATEYVINATAGEGVTSVNVTDNGIIAAGGTCTLTANLDPNRERFDGWFDVTDGGRTLLSAANPYTFTPNRDMDVTCSASAADE